jgi:hypothetical protein
MDNSMATNASILETKIVLKLNSNWRRIGWTTVAQAFTDLMSGNAKTPPALALDIDYELKEDGSPDFERIKSAEPVAWDKWMTLPIREWDTTISTIRQKIRVPTIIISPKFNKMPKKKLRPSLTGIRHRDGDICQYTGKKLTKAEATLDHVLPKSKGGRDSWENLVLCHKDINHKKGNKLNHEAGLKLLKKPVAPPEMLLCDLVTDNKNPDHQHF